MTAVENKYDFPWVLLPIWNMNSVCFRLGNPKGNKSKGQHLKRAFKYCLTVCLEEAMPCSMIAERRTNSEPQRYSACIDHYAKLFRLSSIVRALLDLVKT